jgi:hypothetical protein
VIEVYDTFEAYLKEGTRLSKEITHAADKTTTRQAPAAGGTTHGCLAKWQKYYRESA